MKIIQFFALSILFPAFVLAQSNRGGISGTVFDKTGAVVHSASIIITDLGTNRSERLTSSSEGAFTSPSLEPVYYRIEVEAAGFKKVILKSVKVDTAVTTTVNIVLETGSIENSITISAEPAAINVESGTSGQTINERQIRDLPLNNRSVLDLIMTVGNVSGVVGTEDPELGQEIPAPGFNVNVNGGRAGSTAILADGANNTGAGLGRAVVSFSPDTIQEFTVQTSNFSAEFGRTGGGVVNMTTKSGTNQMNGLAYWYHRNPSLNAAPFTTNVNNRPQANRRQHQFGLTLGGPVRLPKKIFGPAGYDGRDRTFFFVAIEPRYYYDASQFTLLLPTPEMLRGDFSGAARVNGGLAPRAVVEKFGIQNQILDATIYNQWTVNGGIFTRRTLTGGATYPAFPDNKIPANMLDPLSQSLIKYLPTAGEYFLSDGNLRNYASESFIKNLEKRMTFKIDHQFNSKNRISGRYTMVPIRGDRGRGDFQVGRDEINSGGTDYSWSRQILLTDTHIFSPRIVNEVRLNYTYGRFTKNFPPGFDALNGRNLSTELGLPSLTAGGLPEFLTGPTSIGFSLSQQNENAEHSYGIADTLSWVRGNMSWKFGVDLIQQRLKTIPMYGAAGGRYEFNRNLTLTNQTGGNNTTTGGSEFAQFLLGVYNQATLREVFIPYYYQWNSAAAFVQNDWKVRPNLTFNLGMRYTLQLPRTEKYDRQGAFLPELAKEFPITGPCPQCLLPTGQTVTSALVIPFAYSGRGGRSRYIFPVEKFNFDPRFGFAYSPHWFGWNDKRKFIIRGGYGMSHVSLNGMGRNPSPDFASGTTAFGTFDQRVQFPGANVAARLCCNKPVVRPVGPDAFLNIPEDGLIYLNSLNIAGLAVSPNAHVPYVQSFSFSLGYEFPKRTVLELSYNGSKGTRLFMPPVNLNPVPFEITEAYLARGINPLNDVADPLGRLLPNGSARVFSQGYIGSKYLGFEGLSMMFDSSGTSIRHAATASIRRQHSQGLSYTLNYTFGKGLDTSSDAGDVRFVNLNVRSPGHVNFGAPRSADRSVSTFDIKHAFSATWLWDLPIGRGQKLLGNTPGWINNLIGNWGLSGVGRIQGGLPMVVFLRDDNRLGIEGNVRGIRPDWLPDVPLRNPNWSPNCPTGQNCEPYFNPSAFMRPAKGALGSAPRTFDQARSPRQEFLDLALRKEFVINKERRRRLEVRVDFINAFNHPVFRIGRLEDAGEIFALPNEALITNADYDAWRAFDPTRPARTTTEGAAKLAAINAIINNNRVAGTQVLPRDFFRTPLPDRFFSLNANSFDISTLEGLKLYRLRQVYTGDRWGYLDVANGRSGYTPRFIQFALKLYF